MKRLVRAACMGGFLAAVLAACGGGGDTQAPAPTPSGSATNPPRIEAYEGVRTASLQLRSAQAKASQPVAAVVRLGPMASGEPTVTKSAGSPGKGSARQIGAGRPIAAAADVAATRRLLTWQADANGGLATAASFRSDGATSVRLGLLVQALPAEAVVRIATPGGEDLSEFSGAQILATLARNLKAGDASAAGRTFWLPSVGGQDAVLEISLPPGVDPKQVAVAVPHLSHQWVDLARGKDAFLKIGEAATCNLDASCFPEYDDESRAVARMEFVVGTNAFLCTGTLMADVAATGTPWFFSARHCISDQTAASTLATYWFYRSSSCDSGALGPAARRITGGAELLYESIVTDTAFMRLQRDPPAGVLFAGSLLAAPPTGTQVAGLHHPVGDLLKFSRGDIVTYADCTVDQDRVGCGQAGDKFAAVRWTSGTTQQGSSGSAIFTRVGVGEYVSGHLYAGLASCLRPDEPDYYGRFDIPYRDALYRWLGDVAGAR